MRPGKGFAREAPGAWTSRRGTMTKPHRQSQCPPLLAEPPLPRLTPTRPGVSPGLFGGSPASASPFPALRGGSRGFSYSWHAPAKPCTQLCGVSPLAFIQREEDRARSGPQRGLPATVADAAQDLVATLPHRIYGDPGVETAPDGFSRELGAEGARHIERDVARTSVHREVVHIGVEGGAHGATAAV